MKITKYIHSCILVEKQGQGLLIDPGSFSFIEGKVDPEQFKNLSAIFITHAHGDHYNIDALSIFTRNNPDLKIFTNSDMAKILLEYDVSCETFEEGEREVGVFKVKALFAEHNPLPKAVPKNTAYIFDNLFMHPGDSTHKILIQYKVPILALPIEAPWVTSVHDLEFVNEFRPCEIIPVHDGHVKYFYSKSQYEMWQSVSLSKNIKFHALLNPGDSIDIS